MQNNTEYAYKTAINDKIKNKYTIKVHKNSGYVSAVEPYRMRNRNAKERYVEILNFQHLTNYVTFTKDGDDFRNKELRNKIEVSVVLDMECVDMLIHD